MEFFFIHSFSKYVLSMYSVPDATLVSGNIVIKPPEACRHGVFNSS